MTDRTTGLPRDLEAALSTVAATSVLVVASDFDGTLSPIVDDPFAARADPEAVDALSRLSELERTCCTIISGRSLEDLAARAGASAAVTLIGSHGAEASGSAEDVASPPPVPTGAVARLWRETEALARQFPGAVVERKPLSVAFHYRHVPPARQADALAAVRDGPASHPGVVLRSGKKVAEMMVVAADKGSALDRFRRAQGATGMVFVGDDATDEDAFAILSEGDVGVKVGGGSTRARYRLEDRRLVSEMLRTLAHLRGRYVESRGSGP